MGDEAKESFAQAVADAYAAGDLTLLHTLCASYEATVDLAENTVLVKARPHFRAEPIEITVMKAAP